MNQIVISVKLIKTTYFMEELNGRKFEKKEKEKKRKKKPGGENCVENWDVNS